MGKRGKRAKTDNKNYFKLVILIILLIFFLFLIFFSLYLFIDWKMDGTKIANLQSEAEEQISELDEDIYIMCNPPSDTGSDYYYYIKFPFLNADIASLKEKNPDTVGYIDVSNTNISYPIVQTTNNSYYLTHAFDKTQNKAGWVFSDYRNNLDDLSDNTIIYGHNRVDGTIFGTLKNTLTDEWQQDKDNYVIRISSENCNYVFQIFSIYTVENETYYLTTDFSSYEEKQTWLDTMKNRNTSIIDTDVSYGDKILTLSTCENTSDGNRIVVQAKLIKKSS